VEGKAVLPIKHEKELETYVTNKSVQIITMPINYQENYIQTFVDICEKFEEEEMSKNASLQVTPFTGILYSTTFSKK
jgi:hypothetical protein